MANAKIERFKIERDSAETGVFLRDGTSDVPYSHGYLIDQLFNWSEKRLARLLLLLAHFGKEGRPQPILLDMSQKTLAEMIGTTRSRVSYFMNKFRKLGPISYNGKIEVHNSLLNAVLHEKPEIEGHDPSSKV
jgi:CRP/FNR family cyclic AMP-dependent transcriptional regulator